LFPLLGNARRRGDRVERSVGAELRRGAGEGRRRLVSERGRTSRISPAPRDALRAWSKRNNRLSSRITSRIPALNESTQLVCISCPPQCGAITAVILRPARVAFEVNPCVVVTIISGLPRRIGQFTCRPTSGDRHVRDRGQAFARAIIDDIERAERCPQANRSCRKSGDQRVFDFASTRIERGHGHTAHLVFQLESVRSEGPCLRARPPPSRPPRAKSQRSALA